MKIIDIFNEKEITLSFEVFPPKTDAGYEAVEKAAAEIAALKPDFMSVTYGAGGGISKNTAIVSFKFIYNSKCSIFLEIIHLIPDFTAFEASSFVSDVVIGNIIKKLFKNIVQSHEINELWRVFLIDRSNLFNYFFSNVFCKFWAFPYLVKHL